MKAKSVQFGRSHFIAEEISHCQKCVQQSADNDPALEIVFNRNAMLKKKNENEERKF